MDDDLILELNQVAHDNQLAYLPFARSGRAEALLFDRYPELAEKIERSKRAKVDAIVLSNKYADVDGLSSSFRAQSLEEVAASPLRQRTKRRVSKEAKSPALTPALKGKASVQDLMFEMSDGEQEEDETHGKIKPPRFTKTTANDGQNDTPLGSPEAPWSTSRTQGRNSLGSFDKGFDILPQSVSPLPPPALETPRPPGQPWGAAPLSGAKLDLRDIMAQTSTSTPSNLSLGLSRRDSEQKAASSHAKMSQKERKRLQQAQQLGAPIEKAQPAPPAVSPWQAASQRKPSSTPIVAPVSQPSPKASPQPTRAPSTPQLTMRQTIANNGGASKQKGKRSTSQATSEPSGAASPKRPAANERGMSVSTDPIPTPRSVRHIPLPQHDPTSPSQNLSMMEILSIQEAEKTSIRDAAAKRSLQEIQQEQEFQAWWDEESKRVIQEEEQRKRAEERAARNAARGKSSKPRGGRGVGKVKKDKDGAGEGDRGKQSRDVSQGPASAPTKSAPKQDGGERGRGRGRGHRGGRGGPRGGRMQGRGQRDGPATIGGAQEGASAQ